MEKSARTFVHREVMRCFSSLERRRDRLGTLGKRRGKEKLSHRVPSPFIVQRGWGGAVAGNGMGNGHAKLPLHLMTCCNSNTTRMSIHGYRQAGAWFSSISANARAAVEEDDDACPLCASRRHAASNGRINLDRDHGKEYGHNQGHGSSSKETSIGHDDGGTHENRILDNTRGNYNYHLDDSINEVQAICRDLCEDNYLTNNLPLPPPLPEPKFSFHRRVMPESLIQFSSPEGRALFKESLAQGTSEAFFPLSEQFLNQSDPAYCGVTSLVMILNAIGIDPEVRWKGGWRWYADEMILETCCINAERVKRAGILMEEFQSLARCQGLAIDMKRPLMYGYEDGDDLTSGDEYVDSCQDEKEGERYHDLDEFRENIIQMVQNPPIYSRESTNGKGGFMVVSFSRSSLGQTGEGHFSPVAAYHKESDRCLVMDVARFKYAPYWVYVKDLYESTRPIDPMTGKSRGWFMMYPSPDAEGFRGMKAHDEAKRSADSVPLYSTQEKNHICRVDGVSQDNE